MRVFQRLARGRRRAWRHGFYLGLVLFGLWLLLSGSFKPLLLGLGFLSTLLVVYIALRMDVADHEGRSIHINVFRPVGFWVWLVGQIVRANLHVTYRVLHPRLPISPEVFHVRASQDSELGRVTYANSVTLTPGTIAIDLQGNELEIHALDREAVEAMVGHKDSRAAALDL